MGPLASGQLAVSPSRKLALALVDGIKSSVAHRPEKVDNCDFLSFHSMH